MSNATRSGATPEVTLFASILREINGKGKDAGFTKVDRGLFAIVAKKWAGTDLSQNGNIAELGKSDRSSIRSFGRSADSPITVCQDSAMVPKADSPLRHQATASTFVAPLFTLVPTPNGSATSSRYPTPAT